jgi:hypothetical protein
VPPIQSRPSPVVAIRIAHLWSIANAGQQFLEAKERNTHFLQALLHVLVVLQLAIVDQ